MQRQQLLRCALPLIREHGFSRKALALSALSLPTPHVEPLSDPAVSALFGKGDEARRTLINSWMDEGRLEMEKKKGSSVGMLLKSRLRWNGPALPYLPEAFALMASPVSGLPPLDLMPAAKHAGSIADQACYLSGDKSTGSSWYTRRTTLGAIYIAAELHQLRSPETAEAFLDGLLEGSRALDAAVVDSLEFVVFAGRSWAGIIRSLGLK